MTLPNVALRKDAEEIIALLRSMVKPDQDPRYRQAINEVFSTYGDVISIDSKKKSLNKFGRNQAVGTSWETVAVMQGATAEETFVSTNLIDSIVSSSTSDTTQTITVEGHTIDGSGNLTFVTQNVALTGQTEATLSTPLARATRAFVKASGTFNSPPAALVGTVYIYDNTDGISSGVPVTAAATKLIIDAGNTQSEKCATSISSADYWLIEMFSGDVGSGTPTANYVTFRVETRDVFNGGPWRPIGRDIVAVVGAAQPEGAPFHPLRIVPKNHDVRVQAICDSGSAPVFAEISGVLASVVT